jgi:hypothetical protein
MSDSGVCQTILKRKPNVRIRKRWTPVAVYYYFKKEPTSNKGGETGHGWGWVVKEGRIYNRRRRG